jgi:hypothetical protein
MDHPLLKLLVGGSAYAIIIGLVIAGLQFYGIINANLGEACFFGAWLVGIIGLVYFEYQWDTEVFTKVFVGVMVLLLFGAFLYRLNSWAAAHRPVENVPPALPQNGLQPKPPSPKLPPIHHPTSQVLSPNDIRVDACSNTLNLNTEIHSSTKFDGPQDCTLIITSDSKVMLKNALLQIRVMPRTVKINTVPSFTPVPDSPDGEIENELLQIPIVQTVAKGGVPFTVLLELPRSSKRYGLIFQIITDDGRMLGWWGVDIIPAHESG